MPAATSSVCQVKRRLRRYDSAIKIVAVRRPVLSIPPRARSRFLLSRRSDSRQPGEGHTESPARRKAAVSLGDGDFARAPGRGLDHRYSWRQAAYPSFRADNWRRLFDERSKQLVRQPMALHRRIRSCRHIHDCLRRITWEARSLRQASTAALVNSLRWLTPWGCGSGIGYERQGTRGGVDA